MNPHLCLFTDSLEPSGVGAHMLALVAEMRRHYRISLICPPTAAGTRVLGEAQKLGAAVLPLEAQFHQPAALATLRAWLAERAVDIFHGHAGIGWEGFGGVDAARAAGVPVIVRTEHLPYLLTHPVQRADHARIVGAVDCLICVSEAARASFLAAGLPAAKLRVVRNGIPLPARGHPDSRRRAALRAALDLRATDRLVLTVGRFTEQKGYGDLLAAIPAVLARVPAARFAWVGTGPLQEALVASAAALGLTAQLQFLGARSDVPALLAAADLFVLPSLFEGLPLVLLEAMAAGLPVVATRVCGTSEVVVDGVTGRLAPPADPAALAAALCEGLRDPARAAAWGAAGRARVAREFTAARMAAETALIYEEIPGLPQRPQFAVPERSTAYSLER